MIAWAVVRVGLLPLDRMGHTAGAIAGGDLSHRVESVDPRTEVGRLGLALNAMLDRLEHAFSQREASENRLRTFLADASHELRTPLASIRGYAELFRMGAARDPEEAARAMRRIEDEAARMGMLVEDLLTLARLDEIAEAPHRSVDLGALAEDAVSDARVTAPDRSITLAAGPGTTVSGRRTSAPPGPREPDAQRVGAHAGREPGSTSRSPTATGACALSCATTARACRPTTPTRCSSASGAPRAAASAAAPALGWAWRSSPRSSTRTVGPWALRMRLTVARCSRSSCRPSSAVLGELRLGREVDGRTRLASANALACRVEAPCEWP